MIKTLVSVIIPTYNRKKMLIQAINSVKHQTYSVSEIIVVDDFSDFNVKIYLENFYTEDFLSKIKVIRNEFSKGAARSRNIGVEYASNDIVAFLDSDDYWLPEKIEKQMGLFKSSLDIAFVSCNLHEVDKYGNFIKSKRQLLYHNIWKHLLEGWANFPNTSSLICKKDIFQNLGGFDPELTSCQDHDLWMRIGKSGTMVRYINEELYVIMTGASNRISSNYPNRLKGVNTFLSKWSEDISFYKGEKHFKWFRNNYLVLAAFSIFLSKVRKLKFREAINIYFNNFIANPVFYDKLARRLIKKIIPEQKRYN